MYSLGTCLLCGRGVCVCVCVCVCLPEGLALPQSKSSTLQYVTCVIYPITPCACAIRIHHPLVNHDGCYSGPSPLRTRCATRTPSHPLAASSLVLSFVVFLSSSSSSSVPHPEPAPARSSRISMFEGKVVLAELCSCYFVIIGIQSVFYLLSLFLSLSFSLSLSLHLSLYLWL